MGRSSEYERTTGRGESESGPGGVTQKAKRLRPSISFQWCRLQCILPQVRRSRDRQAVNSLKYEVPDLRGVAFRVPTIFSWSWLPTALCDLAIRRARRFPRDRIGRTGWIRSRYEGRNHRQPRVPGQDHRRNGKEVLEASSKLRPLCDRHLICAQPGQWMLHLI
jgi:hypothetical protein